MTVPERIERLREALSEARLDGIYVSSPVDDVTLRHSQNRRYLTGFTGSTGHLIVTQDHAILAADPRYQIQAREESERLGIEILNVQGQQKAWMPMLVAESGLRAGSRLGVSRSDVSYGGFLALSAAVESMDTSDRPELVPASIIEPLRAHKDAAELELIETAIRIASEAFAAVHPTIEPGMKETEVADALEREMKRLGARGHSFEPIVAGGPRGAMPHASPSERVFVAGEPIVVDWGAEFEGYCSDLTRTFCLGPKPEKFIEIHRIVGEAQETAIAGIEEGMTGAQAHALAAGTISKHGFGESFTHGLGHGVGLEVHDYPPLLSPTSEDILADGMVFTIEPGIYLPDWGGVRIEDIVVMDNGRARRLSGGPPTSLE